MSEQNVAGCITEDINVWSPMLETIVTVGRTQLDHHDHRRRHRNQHYHRHFEPQQIHIQSTSHVLVIIVHL